MKHEKISRILQLLESAPDVLNVTPNVLFGNSQPLKAYIDLFVKLFQIKGLGAKLPVYASADITNICNLKCKHCYWWRNWKQCRELSPEEWRTVIRNKFVKEKIYQVALTGGEPLLRPEVIKVFREEIRNEIWVVTNGTLPLIDFNRISYFVSIDGTEKIHNYIRGLKIYEKVKQNVREFDGEIVLNMTINTINFKCIEDVVKEWYGLINTMNFQFYTPFDINDNLWIPFGKKRDEIIDRLIMLKEEYPIFLNTKKQLNLLRSNEWTKDCPNWAFLSLNHLGQVKKPCLMGGIRKPICERCGMCENAGMYTAIYQGDVEWLEIFKKRNKIRNK